mgnify:CR=1 FL=1
MLDPSTCGCVLKDLNVGPEKKGEGREERSEEQEDPLLLKWEYPVILTLASLNLLLICIIVVLAKRHRNLRRKMEQQKPRYKSHTGISLRDTFFPAMYPEA